MFFTLYSYVLNEFTHLFFYFCRLYLPMSVLKLKDVLGTWHILPVLNVIDILAESGISWEMADHIAYIVMMPCSLNIVITVVNLLEWTRDRWPTKASIGMPQKSASVVILAMSLYLDDHSFQEEALYIVLYLAAEVCILNSLVMLLIYTFILRFQVDEGV